MFIFQIIDNFTNPAPGGIWPSSFTLEHWRFLWETPKTGESYIWTVTFNTFIFASTTSIMVTSLSMTSGYVLSRLDIPGRKIFLAGLIMLHAFPTISLIVAIFLTLQIMGLYNTLLGVILVKSALELPFGVWIMKGFYDTVPWEIEMAGIQDGASRFTVWRKLILPQVQPGIAALLIFSFLSGWSEFVLPLVLAPSSDVQVLSTYLSALILDDNKFDFNLFKSVGTFYAIPVIIIYIVFQKKLMNIYGGGTKG
tara:strand:- start:220 stop:978 length:759 start_codon:yes stop_codon:yes gene_type:complete